MTLLTMGNTQRSKASLHELVSALKQFKGITRKSALGPLLPIVGENVYDDAGVLEVGDIKVVVSTDGIVEDLVRDDPWLAGFYSVVVNVNDVVAKGARPLGYTHVLSSSSPSVRRQIVTGIKHGIDKYGLKFLKGHTHPDTSYDAIDAAVVGLASNVLSSATAKPGDNVIVAVDTDGNFGLRGWVRTFDSVMFKTIEQVWTRLEAIVQLAEKRLANACRDISGPGVVGTICMLCESSRVGTTINLDALPKPDGIEFKDWLMTYPSTGFVLTTDKPEASVRLLMRNGLTAEVVGKIVDSKTIQVSWQRQVEAFMDLERESIFGLEKVDTEEKKTKNWEVIELSKVDAPAIEALLQKVWSTAYEYPEEWRRKRILGREQIRSEMLEGYRCFGVKMGNRLVGFYKALITKEGMFGEQQSVDPNYRGLGLAAAMYHQFIEYAKQKNCKKVYVNTLVNQASTLRILRKMGFRKKGQEYEQAKGMKVQMHKKNVQE